ncbi:hypothetical protein [Paracoccus seriniphilus]|uniref:hypothetical protein n=1 Tax=Paracoccus seriniphilus TaxID=184748 RepID=UPI00356505BF
MGRVKNIHDMALGATGVILSLAVLWLWIPADIDTGVIDVWRRVTRIGDAMLPTFSCIAILLASLIIALRGWAGRQADRMLHLDPAFLLLTMMILTIGITLMFITGPVLVRIFLGADRSYPLLRDEYPWKYTGFVTGGTFLVFAFHALVCHRFSRRAAAIALLATVAIAAIYGLPFDDLLLPPNGDV